MMETSPLDRGPWIQTFGGKRFHLLTPHPDEVFINDIAWSLGHICRYNGHCHSFYSVAQHSVLVSQLVPPELALTGLLHDAAEAYSGDITRPMKEAIPELRGFEHRIEQVIADKFHLDWPWPEAVKTADNIALATEKRDILAADMVWDYPVPEPHPAFLAAWASSLARTKFLLRFNELTGRRL